MISAIPTGKHFTAEPPVIDANTKAMVNMLFARFMVIYGHKFKSNFETDQELGIAKREWALSLAPYTEDVLLVAIEETKQRFSWMPSIAEFLQLLEKCQHQFGLPSVEDAYLQACLYADTPLEHVWQHAIIYHAGKKTGWYELRTNEKRLIFSRFTNHYTHYCQRVLAGETFPLPPQLQLPDTQSVSLFADVKAWGERQGLDDEQAQTLLYYLHLSARNPLRLRLLKQHQQTHSTLFFPTSNNHLQAWLAQQS